MHGYEENPRVELERYARPFKNQIIEKVMLKIIRLRGKLLIPFCRRVRAVVSSWFLVVGTGVKMKLQ